MAGLEIHDGSRPVPDDHVRFVCISDTHCSFPQLPAGDVLLHAGDFSFLGTLPEVHEFNKYLGTLPFKHRIVIAGNHDVTLDLDLFEENVRSVPPLRGVDAAFVKARLVNCTYLEDSGVEVEGYKVWGAPGVYADGYCGAFTYQNPERLRPHWNKIPPDTDIIVTHSPPYGIMDIAWRKNLGCPILLEKVNEVKPLVHLFGHIHEGRGHLVKDGVNFINAAICNEESIPAHQPFVFDLPRKT